MYKTAVSNLLATVAFVTARIKVARDEAQDRGATATEYAILVAFIAIVVVVGVTAFGTALSNFFHDLSNTIGGWTSSTPSKGTAGS